MFRKLATGVASFLGEMGLFGALYFSQRMVEGFVAVALLFHLFGKNRTIEEAATFSIVIAVPGALKWLWAPVVDRWGSRIGWILGLTLAMAGTIFFLPEAETFGLGVVMAVAALNSIALATQDLVADGVAIDVLPKERRWPAQLTMSIFSKLGMSVGAGLALFWLRGEILPWEWICRLMAGFVLVSGAAVFLLWKVRGVREGVEKAVRQVTNWRTVVRSLWNRNVVALLLVGLFVKAASSMTAPLIPRWFGTLNFGAGWEASVITADGWLKLAGAVIAGLLASRFGGRRVAAVCALLFGVAYASLGAFPSYWGDSAIVFVEIACGSLGEGALIMAFLLLAMGVAAETPARVTVFALIMAAGNASELWAKWACKQLWGAELAGGTSEAEAIAYIFLLAGAAQLLVLVGIALMREEKGGEPPS